MPRAGGHPAYRATAASAHIAGMRRSGRVSEGGCLNQAVAPQTAQTGECLKASARGRQGRAAQRRPQEGRRCVNGAHEGRNDQPAPDTPKSAQHNRGKQYQRGIPLELAGEQPLAAHSDIQIVMRRIDTGPGVMQADVEHVKAARAFLAVKAQMQMRHARAPEQQRDAEQRQQPGL